jgi:hypothetical protein
MSFIFVQFESAIHSIGEAIAVQSHAILCGRIITYLLGKPFNPPFLANGRRFQESRANAFLACTPNLDGASNTGTAAHTETALANNSATKLLLYETWARPDRISAGFFPNLQAMQTQLHDSYSAAAADFQLAGWAPVGDSFLEAIRLGFANDPNDRGVRRSDLTLEQR